MQLSVAQSFLDAVERHRSSTALVTQDGSWSYDDLGRLTGAVSAFIGSTSLERGERVAVLLPNSAEYAAAYFGVQLAGGVSVAMNTQEPATVIHRLIRHCDAKLLFVDAKWRDLRRLAELFGDDGPDVIRVGDEDGPWGEILRSCSRDFRRHVIETRSGDLASIIYTSGTTGNPKGVMLSHRNLHANTQSILQYIDISWVDRTLNVLPFYYSFGNSILMTHLTAGACIVLHNNIAFPHAVLKRITEEKVTGFYGVPTTFMLLYDPERIASTDLSTLRYVAQAGGPMSVDKQQQLMRDLPNVRIFIMYGQTEATARLTYLEPERIADKQGSVGKAIPGVEIRVGAVAGERHDADSPGEVYAHGDNIMMGYWNDATATNEVIRDGWLRTGDLGYFDNDGFLYLTGRASDMIKTGANRVSPAEIEDVVGQIAGVREVGAYAVDDEVLGQAIAVAVIASSGADLDVKAIRRHCLAEMSAYKVPKYVRFVTELPKTASGKLRRHILTAQHEEKAEQ